MQTSRKIRQRRCAIPPAAGRTCCGYSDHSPGHVPPRSSPGRSSVPPIPHHRCGRSAAHRALAEYHTDTRGGASWHVICEPNSSDGPTVGVARRPVQCCMAGMYVNWMHDPQAVGGDCIGEYSGDDAGSGGPAAHARCPRSCAAGQLVTGSKRATDRCTATDINSPVGESATAAPAPASHAHVWQRHRIDTRADLTRHRSSQQKGMAD